MWTLTIIITLMGVGDHQLIFSPPQRFESRAACFASGSQSTDKVLSKDRGLNVVDVTLKCEVSGE